jgi:hypothetical protein
VKVQKSGYIHELSDFLKTYRGSIVVRLKAKETKVRKSFFASAG